MYKKIIVFEGIDGSGKTFHLNSIAKFLKKKKIRFIQIREPGGSPNSEILRKIILKNTSTFKKKTDLLLYMAARNENFENIIKSNYRKKVILIDRFIDSTFAYQHYGFNISKKIIKDLNKFILGSISPDFTFLHTLPERLLKKKISGKKNRYDKFNTNFYSRVQKGFIKLGKNNKKYLIINANNSKFDNIKIIQNKIINLLNL